MARSKKSCQYLHAKRRCLERYGLELKKSQYKQLVAMIQRNQAEFVESESNRVTIWIIKFLGKELKVVYDNHRHSIATFLPLNESNPNLQPST